MNKKLQVSTELALPRDTVTSTLIVYGGKGMGKTVFGAVLAEELSAGGLRWAWLDPLGVGYGLRYGVDGTGKGVECLILGGVRGDIPITPDSGAAVADIVVEETVNVLIDFSRKQSGEMWGVGEKIRFSAAYARRLFQRQGDLVGGRRRGSLMQFLDEGARYIPQVVPAGNPGLAESVSAWQQFCEEGRNVGLGLCVLTQRSARINKDIAELADAMVAFRTVGPNSLGAVLDWLGDHVQRDRLKELSAEVRKLPRGSALVVSPGWLEIEKVVPIRMRKTFDSSATPKPGQRARQAQGAGARPNLERIRAKMAEIIEKAKVDDPKAVHAENIALKKQIEVFKKTLEKIETKGIAVKVTALGAHEVAVDSRHLKEIVDATVELEKRLEGFTKDTAAFTSLARGVISLSNVTYKTIRQARQTGSQALAKRLEKAPGQRGQTPSKTRTVSESNALSKGELAILIAVAQHPDGVTREQLTVLTGYKRSTRDAYLQRLGVSGFVTHDEDRIFATADARTTLGDFEPLPTGRALLEYWLERLPEGERKVLDAVSNYHPNAISRDTISEATAYKRSTRDAYVQRLTTRRLVKSRPDGGIVLSETLVG